MLDNKSRGLKINKFSRIVMMLV